MEKDMARPTDPALMNSEPEALRPTGFDPSRDDCRNAFESGHEEGFIAGVAAVVDPRLHHQAIMACVRLGKWMSAALDDPSVCEAMKADIREWFSSGEPQPGWGKYIRDSDASLAEDRNGLSGEAVAARASSEASPQS